MELHVRLALTGSIGDCGVRPRQARDGDRWVKVRTSSLDATSPRMWRWSGRLQRLPGHGFGGVFDIALVARWRDHRVRVLQQAGEEVLVLVTPDSLAYAEAPVPAAELEDKEGVRSGPVPMPASGTYD